MSDISCSSCSSNKRRLSQIDDTIEYLSQDFYTTNNNNVYENQNEFEYSLMNVKMKRENVRAVAMFTNSRILIANMEYLLAENDLCTAVERLKNCKRRKLDRNEVATQVDIPSPPQVTPVPLKTTVAVQTTKCSISKTKKPRRSSSRKSPVDISSDETVIIPSIFERAASVAEGSQTLQTSFPPGLFTKTAENQSDSEFLITSSIKAEFNEPYTKTNTPEPVNKSPTKKNTSEKKGESKSKSKHVSKSQKTVTEEKKKDYTSSNRKESSYHAGGTSKSAKSGEKSSTATATYMPVRHNMGMRSNQHSPNPSTQANRQNQSPKAGTSRAIQNHSPRAGTSRSFYFYGNYQ